MFAKSWTWLIRFSIKAEARFLGWGTAALHFLATVPLVFGDGSANLLHECRPNGTGPRLVLAIFASRFVNSLREVIQPFS
jgi:hypothetical protein